MSSGFWAGAVPPWAYVVGGALGLALLFAGIWYGYGRGWKHRGEEEKWKREEAKARRVHPVYRQPPEVAHEAWLAHEEQALSLVSSARQPAIDTGEIQAITDRADAWMAKWIGDGHALCDS